jgi:hypothetical protein
MSKIVSNAKTLLAIFCLIIIILLNNGCKEDFKKKQVLNKPIRTIEMPFYKSQFLRYPTKFYDNDSNNVLIDYSTSNLLLTYSLINKTIDTLIIPKILEKEFFVRVSNSRIIFITRELDTLYEFNNKKLTKKVLDTLFDKFNLNQPLTTGIYYSKNCIFFGIIPKHEGNSLAEYIKLKVDKNIIGKINLLDDKGEICCNYPKNKLYSNYIRKYNGIEHNYQFVINDLNEIVLSFPLENQLFEYKKNSTGIHKFKFELIFDSLNTCDLISHFNRIYYDKYRKLYYLTYAICNKENNMLHQYERNWNILVFDNNYKLIKTIEVPKNEYCRGNLEIIREGILLIRDFSKNINDTSKFKTYDLFKTL